LFNYAITNLLIFLNQLLSFSGLNSITNNLFLSAVIRALCLLFL
jgi:hypothetical protein